MSHREPSHADLAAENARLREQVATLSERNEQLEARSRTLLGDRSSLLFGLATPDGDRLESPAWSAFTGQAPEALRRGGAIEAIHPEDRERAAQGWQDAVATRQPYECEVRLRRHDGVYRWFALRSLPVRTGPGGVLEWVGWCQDIEPAKHIVDILSERSARIDAEVARRSQALSRSEAMLAESQRLAKIGSFELDVALLRLTWSAQQFRNFGLPPAPLIGRSEAVKRIHPDDVDRHEAAVRRALETGEAFTIDYRVVHPDGQVRHLHTIGQPVVDTDGRVVRLVGTSQDVTERTRLEEQLRAQYEQLMKLDKLKSDFVDSVTHELRTPLTSIMGYAEFLEDEVGGPATPEQQEFVGQIQRGARRLEYLLNDLLDFARMEAGTFMLKVQPAELGSRLHEVVESLRPQADEALLALTISLPDGPLTLEMDAQRIGQVLMNLLANAIKFSPRGGAVGITARRMGERVRCEIADSGPGIAIADRPRLFQRFSQLEGGVKMGKGAGLGLSICKALVEAHGGVIGVESAPGAGSTFWFELPMQAPPEASAPGGV